MSEAFGIGGRLPAAFMNPGTSSFIDFLAQVNPDLLPGRRNLPQGDSSHLTPDATTIVALTFPGGVLLAGDRRATSGNVIANRDMDKLFRADEFSAVAIAGSAGIGIELARLFQVELEHYEKREGRPLSLEGKANRLASMIRGNLGMALQGFVVVPLLVGYDEPRGEGRIFSYDPVGGRYEEHRYHSIGSGSVYARGSLKKLYRDDLSEEDAALVALQALYDAADDDSATGGPDVHRRIYPLVDVITDDGHRRLPADEVAELADTVVTGRSQRPDGPTAPLS
ncbi:proteasome endopeptidase complex, beta component Threonine peptidase. MEROPS family T01B [Marinactinospora thermotolerans DSM 45154]|uniref:Proteasome subunit beta n=1 Tax=Marinactinospora thermotolerans DSM 45154 TaxID=1122192 RepID=A0A1T4T5P3_9ACTN|nr:proteasome subunit beta [Marinactinospora thermotolerans]SKA35762.1 proteasome endopeptidase complex, beta component Threonine peptidase. MEROPS family T01B [Marinactinospora thermotolerans DSM 45154]